MCIELFATRIVLYVCVWISINYLLKPSNCKKMPKNKSCSKRRMIMVDGSNGILLEVYVIIIILLIIITTIIILYTMRAHHMGFWRMMGAMRIWFNWLLVCQTNTKISKEYIERLVFDRRHTSLVLLDPNEKRSYDEINGGICLPFVLLVPLSKTRSTEPSWLI